MSGQGSGSGGPRRSDRLAKGKAVLYEPESPPDTDDKYEAMEDVRTRVDASIARNLQDELDAEATGLISSATRPSSRPSITIGRSTRPSGAPHQGVPHVYVADAEKRAEAQLCQEISVLRASGLQELTEV